MIPFIAIPRSARTFEGRYLLHFHHHRYCQPTPHPQTSSPSPRKRESRSDPAYPLQHESELVASLKVSRVERGCTILIGVEREQAD